MDREFTRYKLIPGVLLFNGHDHKKTQVRGAPLDFYGEIYDKTQGNWFCPAWQGRILLDGNHV